MRTRRTVGEAFSFGLQKREWGQATTFTPLSPLHSVLRQQEPAYTQNSEGVEEPRRLFSLSSCSLVPGNNAFIGSEWQSRVTKAPDFQPEDREGEPQPTGKCTREIAKRKELGRVTLKAAYELWGSALSCAHMGLTPSSLPETLGTQLRGDHLEPTLATGHGKQGGQPLKMELTPRPRPTRLGGMQPEPSQPVPARAKLPAFSVVFKQDPNSQNNTLFKMSRIQSIIT